MRCGFGIVLVNGAIVMGALTFRPSCSASFPPTFNFVTQTYEDHRLLRPPNTLP